MPQIHRDFAELFQSRFKVFNDFLSENIGIGEIVGFFQAFISQPEDIEAGFVAVNEFVVRVRAPATVGILFRPSRFALIAVLRVVALNEFVRSSRFNGLVFKVKCLLVRRS